MKDSSSDEQNQILCFSWLFAKENINMKIIFHFCHTEVLTRDLLKSFKGIDEVFKAQMFHWRKETTQKLKTQRC